MSKPAISTPEQQEKHDRLERIRRNRADNAIKYLLADDRGLWFLGQLIYGNGLYTPITVGNAALTAEQVGKRGVAIDQVMALQKAVGMGEAPGELAKIEAVWRRKPEEGEG